MYENNSQQNPADFLDQIAPKSNQNSWLMSKKPLLIGLGAMIMLLIAIFIGMLSSGSTQTVTRLAARLQDTTKIAESATQKIKDSQLRALNSNLKQRLLSQIQELTPFVVKEGAKIDNLDKKLIASETSTAIMSVLEDARLNGTYDRIYAREMAFKLDTVITLMNQLKKTSNNKSLKDYLTNSINNLTPIQKDFADFNATNS